MAYIHFEPYRQGPYRYRLTQKHVHSLETAGFSAYEGGQIRARDGEVVAEVYSQNLVLHAGYVWDGPSGPALDTVDFQRASLVHDALYQMARKSTDWKRWKRRADKEMRRIAIEDGMPRWRAWYAYTAVRWFGKARDGYFA